MITLILVTIPIEIIFLAILHNFGWLQLPIVFAIFSLAFFCCAVSALIFLFSHSFSNNMAGLGIPYRRTGAHTLFMVEGAGSRHVRATHSLCADGLDRTVALGVVFRASLIYRRKITNVRQTALDYVDLLDHSMADTQVVVDVRAVL